MHLLVFGHSYLWEQFQFIRAAHKILGRISSADYQAPFGHEGQKDAVCTGHAKQIAMPYCARTDPDDGSVQFNCDDPGVMQYTMANGATITGVMNEPKLQKVTYADNLVSWLNQARTATHPSHAGQPWTFTHALVMEPHPQTFFDDATTLTLETDFTYGCGWSDKFWSIFNAAFQGKVMKHLLPWGVDDAALKTSANVPPPENTLKLSTRALTCNSEASKDNGPHLFTANGRTNGHQCTAVRDRTGDFLGPIPHMTKESITALKSGGTPITTAPAVPATATNAMPVPAVPVLGATPPHKG